MGHLRLIQGGLGTEERPHTPSYDPPEVNEAATDVPGNVMTHPGFMHARAYQGVLPPEGDQLTRSEEIIYKLFLNVPRVVWRVLEARAALSGRKNEADSVSMSTHLQIVKE